MNGDRRLELAERLMFGLGKLARGLDAIFREQMEKYGVTWAQFGVLRIVSNAGQVTVTDIANSLMVATPTASKMIDGICKKRLMKKVRDPEDQRLTWIRLTEDGRGLVERLMDLERRVMNEVLEQEDVEELERTVTHLVNILDRWFEATEPRTER